MSVLTTPIQLPKDGRAYFKAQRRFPFPFLLESSLPSPQYGRQSFLGSNPFAVLTSKGSTVELWKEGTYSSFRGTPFDILRDLLTECRTESKPQGPFCGGAVGYFGYDLGRHIEKLPSEAEEDQDYPDLFLAFHDRVLRLDHTSGKAGVIEWEEHRRKRAMPVETYQERFFPLPRQAPSNFTKAKYLEAVRKARDYIGAGDIYQVNLSQRFSAQTDLDPYSLYLRLRTSSPSFYSAYLELGNRAILSSSPEQFLEVRGKTIVTRPIKGTRPRGSTDEEDERLRSDLYNSKKDDAELAMIVDLERNDLGRLCEFGSVRVAQAKVLETHPTVFHLSARIEGTLRNDVDPVDILSATFPGGSVTGAPKIRAMEIIDELEPTRRSVYTGSIGYLSFDGQMDSNIAIRTMLQHGPHVTFQVGGAVVWDSDPEDEYQETLVKALGMASALGIKLE